MQRQWTYCISFSSARAATGILGTDTACGTIDAEDVSLALAMLFNQVYPEALDAVRDVTLIETRDGTTRSGQMERQ